MIENDDFTNDLIPAPLSCVDDDKTHHPNRHRRVQQQHVFPNSPLQHQIKETVSFVRGIVMNQSSPRVSMPRTHSSFGSDDSTTFGIAQSTLGKSLDPCVLKGLTVAGLASTILHTMTGLQTEQKILVSIAEGSASFESTGKSIPQMIRSTHTSKLHHDFIIRMIGTGIIIFYSSYPPIQRHGAKGHHDKICLIGFLLVASFVSLQLVPQLSAIYEWMRVLYIVVLVSPVINDVHMQDTARIRFMMSGQVVNFLTTLSVRYICETLQGTAYDKSPSARITVKYALVALSCFLFVIAQNMIADSKALLSVRHVFQFMGRAKLHTETDSPPQQYGLRPLEVRRSLRDLFYSHNLRSWVGMQIFMEIEMSALYLIFLYAFLYPKDDVGNTRILWTLFRLRKVDTILVYIPMYTFGYAGIYWTLFWTICSLSLLVLVTASEDSVETVYILTIVYYISATAVHSAGFNLAMSDLTRSLRQSLFDRRIDESNIAGILIAMSSFVCKPIAYFVSGIIANILQRGQSSGSMSTPFYCLTIIPLVCSTAQILFWRRYGIMHNELDHNVPK
jgi:hypothetical protein